MTSKRKRAIDARSFIDIEAQEDAEANSEDEEMSEEDAFFIDDSLEPESAPQLLGGAREEYRPGGDPASAFELLVEVATRIREKTQRTKETQSLRQAKAERAVEGFDSGSSFETEDTRRLQMFLLPTRGGQELKAVAYLKKRAPKPCVVLGSRMLLKRIYILAETVDQVIGIATNSESVGVYVTGIKEVPLEDRGAVLYLAQSRLDGGEVFVKRSWVRMRRGPFKHDVGLIINISDSDILQIAVVPRFWDQSVCLPKKRLGQRRRTTERPPQGLLTEEVVRTVFNSEPQPGTPSDSFTFEGDVYLRNGLRIIEAYGIHAAIPVQPHASEIYQFTLLGFNTHYITNKTFLRIGDRVEIQSQEARGVSGTVTYQSGDEAWIKPDLDTHKEPLMVHIVDLQRQFPTGTTVAVRIGELAGREGLVLSELGDELVIFDQQAHKEWKISKACVQTNDLQEYRPRNPTFASMNLLASEGHKDHQLLKKLVYVVPRGKVGPITKVYSKGYVEVLIPQTNESHSNIFTLAEVVDTETFICLDGTNFRDSATVRQALATYVANNTQPLSMDTEVLGLDESLQTNPFPRPPLLPNSLPAPCPLPEKDFIQEPLDSAVSSSLGKVFELTTHSLTPVGTSIPQLPPEIDRALNSLHIHSQEVYVLDPKFKTFGRLVTANGNAHAVVLIDGMHQPLPFPLKDVLTTKTFRCLDNSEAPDIEQIRAEYLARRGKRLVPNVKLTVAHEDTSLAPADVPPTSPPSWICSPVILQIMRSTRIHLRFIDGCISPGDVSGVMAWTTQASSIRTDQTADGTAQKVYVSYRTRDGKLNEAWVETHVLLPCPPRAVDRVLVLKGEDSGKTYQVARFTRKEKKEKTIIVKIGVGKSVKSFGLADVTRISDYEVAV